MTNSFSWLTTRWWILVVACALALALAGHAARVWHVNHVSSLAGGDAIAVDADSLTGYEAGARRIVVPERNLDSFQWIMQTQKMFADGKWRVEQVDYDNAPEGRSVRSPSVYRWWLGVIAWIDHALFDTPQGIAVERAALSADPLAQLAFVIVTGLFIARYFSGWAAALFCVGSVAIFPLGGAFAPGQPDDSTLVVVFCTWSVLPLIAGLAQLSKGDGEGDDSRHACRRLFFLGGLSGGTSMWLGIATALPVLAGIAIAGAVSGFVYSRRTPNGSEEEQRSLPWRAWALGGSLVVLIAWLFERAPELFEATAWRADFAHPLYAFAWLGFGEVLTFLDTARRNRSKRRIATLAAVAIGGLLYTMIFRPGVAAWGSDAASVRLTRLPASPSATSMVGWLQEANGWALVFATVIPSLLLIMGSVAIARARRSPIEVKLLSLAVIPALIAFMFALARLGWWSQLDGLLLVIAVAALSVGHSSTRTKAAVVGVVAVSSVLGLAFVLPTMDKQAWGAVNQVELETLIERHLAQWLARRADEPGAVVLAPPEATMSLAFYGGLRGVGTPYPENYDGFSAAVRLSAASTPDEARALAEGREIEYIVHPSWDTFLEEYARLGSNQPENSFIALLNRWLPPRWLEPVSFHLPSVEGFEGEWVMIFRTVEIQDNVSAIARLVEYFLDAGMGNQAVTAQRALAEGFPDALATHIAGAQVAAARGERGAFGRALNGMLAAIEAGADEFLPWDLRVSMSLMLAGGKRYDEAREQLEECIGTITTERIKRLSPGSLNGLLHLSKAMSLEFPHERLYAQAVSLLPVEHQKGL